MNYLVVIPARGGSKGIVGKNLKKLNGEPLIGHTVRAAREVFKDSQICVSTDSPEIKEVVEESGLQVPFLRPESLATDDASTQGVILHALDYYKSQGRLFDAVVLLQPTSPLRQAVHIQEALSYYTSELDMVVSVTETKSNPYYVLFEENTDGLLEKCKVGHFTRRQDLPSVWELNGAIYVMNVNSLRQNQVTDFSSIKKYVMEPRHSVDIDDYIDWHLAELLMKEASEKLD